MKLPPLWVGIDPGQKGGLVALYNDGSLAWGEALRKLNLGALADSLRSWTLRFDVHVAIERLRPFSIGGVSDRGEAPRSVAPKTVFEMGRQRGRIEGVVESVGLSFVDVEPRAWQKVLGAGHGDRRRIKQESLNSARARWSKIPIPARITVESGVADAAWIADWNRRERRAHVQLAQEMNR